MPVPVKPVIYQLVVRYFGNTKTTNQRDGTLAINGCGRFEDINTAALSSLRQLGVTHIWLTGCLRQATLTDYSAIGIPPDDPNVVKGIAGSFYAVSDYFDVCPDYAINPAHRLAEFDSLIRRIHAAGMQVLIDFVPNHVARGYRSVVKPELDFGVGDDTTRFFDPQNHFFYLVDPPGRRLRLSRPGHWKPPGVAFDGEFGREDGGPGRPPKATGNNGLEPTPSVLDWYDTVKLNYGYNFADCSGWYAPQPRTWGIVDQILSYWQQRGVDGFRCDFAHYVPAEAWTFLISRARQRDPNTFFLAEAYPSRDSGDPITDLGQLLHAGFDAVYHHEAYDRLKRIYQGQGSQDEYDQAMVCQPPLVRSRLVEYLENHDQRRVASPIVYGASPDHSGFGSADAGYQLAPLQFLYSAGPVLLLNGQEVGESGAGFEGYNGDDGRTTIFDYWCMPEFAKWVNEHAYDGGRLSTAQRDLRRFYADLLAFCQDSSIRADGYWGLKYFNRADRLADCPNDLYTFARFQEKSGRLVLVAANFRPTAELRAVIRVPLELADRAGLPSDVSVRLRLDRGGAKNMVIAQQSRQALVGAGFQVTIPNQTAQAYIIE